MSKASWTSWSAGVALALSANVAFADRVIEDDIGSEYQNFRLLQLADGLEHPWSVAFLPDGRYLVTERAGRLNLLEDGQVSEISGVPEVVVMNQGGLLDVSLHPDYEDNGWLYLTYSSGDVESTTVELARARLEGHELVDLEVLFRQDRRSEPGRHYGSRLAWMADGSLLMSIGDRGAEPPRAQDTNDHAGTVIRLAADGSVPGDNPFIGRADVLPEIYSYGHRNIQGLVVDPETDLVWASEHGPRGGDELNLIQAGNNYGWPDVGKGRDYRTEEIFGASRSLPELTDPVHEFLPTHAPSGLALVTSEHFPRWQGNLLVGGLRGERLRRVVLEDQVVVHEEELLLQKIGRIRDVRQSPDGMLYVLTDSSDGGLYRLEPAD